MPMIKTIWLKGLLALVVSQAAMAANFTWTGDTDGNWNTGTNWVGGVPLGANDTSLLFDDAVQPVTTNNIPGGLTLNSLTFGANSGVRSISGNALTFDGTNPLISALDTLENGTTEIHTPVILNQTLTIIGGADIDRQLGFSSVSVISGPGGLRIAGGISVISSNTNTFSGSLVIENGASLGVSRLGGFGNSSGVTIEAGGELQLITGNFPSGDKPLSIAGAGNESGAGYALSAAGPAGTFAVWSGAITLQGDTKMGAINNNKLTLSGLATVDLAGNVLTLSPENSAGDQISISKSVQGNGSILVDAGADGLGARLIPVSSNSFVGSVTVLSGALGINGNSALGDEANVLTINGGILRAGSDKPNSSQVTIPSTRSIVIGENGATFSGRISPNTNEILVLNTVLSGDNPIRIERSVRFNAENTFTGDLTVAPNATLRIQNESGLGAASSVLRLMGDSSATANLTLVGALNLSSARTIEIAGTRGKINIDSSAEIAATITGPGILELNARTFTLTGNNSHGGTLMSFGTTLRISNNSALGGYQLSPDCGGRNIAGSGRFKSPRFPQHRTAGQPSGGHQWIRCDH